VRGGSGTFEPSYEYIASKQAHTPIFPPSPFNAKQTCLHGQTQVGALGQNGVKYPLNVGDNHSAHFRIDDFAFACEPVRRGGRGEEGVSGCEERLPRDVERGRYLMVTRSC
jgi:hypothetical protein